MRHSSTELFTVLDHSVDTSRAGWTGQIKMASVEFWIPGYNFHRLRCDLTRHTISHLIPESHYSKIESYLNTFQSKDHWDAQQAKKSAVQQANCRRTVKNKICVPICLSVTVQKRSLLKRSRGHKRKPFQYAGRHNKTVLGTGA